MKTLLRALRLTAFTMITAAALACGGEDSTTTTQTGQTCKSDHECQNDVCQCTTAGKSGTSCEKDKCENDCEVCSSS